MNILYPVLCYYPSQAGGPANTLYWQNTALVGKGIGSITVASNFGIGASENLNELGESVSYKNHTVIFTDKGIFDHLNKSMKQLKKCQAIHFASIFYPITLPLLLMGVFTKKSVVISPRGELYDAALAIKPKQKAIWLRLIALFQQKIHFHATNDYEKNLIEKTFPKAKSVEIIPNFIKLPNQLSLPTESKFVFLGRINPIKNIDVLIEAFYLSLQRSENCNTKLVIIGSARLPYEKDYLAELKLQIKKLGLNEQVIFKGHLDGDDKQKELASAKALVLPSKSENFGNVVLEALAQGTPVIASTGTPWEVLNEANSGFWVEPTAESFHEAMQKILKLNDNEYQGIRNKALALCKDSFDIASNVHLWIDYYKKITHHV